MDIKEQIQEKLKSSIKELYNLEVDPQLEVPKEQSFGDFASNIAMQIVKEVKKNPLAIAEEIVSKLKESDLDVESMEVAKPGFINFRIAPNHFKNIINQVLKENDSYGKSNIGESKEVMIEFAQPNTHKAFHVGHLRSAISGLSMVKLHENLGYKVIKVNYFGDVGMHVAKSTWGFMQKGKPDDFDSWDVHEKMKYIDECYVFGSSAFKDSKGAEAEIREINKKIYLKEKGELLDIYNYLREISMDHQSDIWKSLGIVFDREYPESEISADALKIIDKFKDQVFEQSDGAIIYNGEKEGLTTWVFLTSEGNPTYSGKDLALASKKFEEYPNLFKAIVTTSVEQKDYFKVVIKVLEKIKPEITGKYFHIPFGWLLRGGKKTSSRMGNSIKGLDIINEAKEQSRNKISEIKEYEETEREEIIHYVANAGLKFLILSHEYHKDINYDPESFIDFNGFSGPYILYSYTRAKSILRNGGYEQEETIEFNNDNVLNEKLELDLLKTISQYPNIVLNAGTSLQPHLVANYLYELAQSFNQFYREHSVLQAESEEQIHSRLALTAATAQVLKNGLNLLGIQTVEKM